MKTPDRAITNPDDASTNPDRVRTNPDRAITDSDRDHAKPDRARSEPGRVEPTEDGERLRIVWRDGHRSEFEPRLLRVNCRCAGCVDEYTGRPLLDPARVAPDVYPLAINRVGRYALQFDWSDGHTTGIYPFELLRELCRCAVCLGLDD
jgi:DUF971 family protein